MRERRTTTAKTKTKKKPEAKPVKLGDKSLDKAVAGLAFTAYRPSTRGTSVYEDPCQGGE